MKLILFLSFVISCFAQSEPDAQVIGYNLALGPLENPLKEGNEKTSYCYQRNKDIYENGVIEFLQKLVEIRKKVDEEGENSPNSKYINWALNEMNNIGNCLNNFFGEFKKNIFNGKLVEGGQLIANTKEKIEDHYRQYEKHSLGLKEKNEKEQAYNFKSISDAFSKILEESKELSEKVVECLKE